MKKSWFWFGFAIILVSALALRLMPTFGNNFYFTMDQGNDAVHVREIWFRHAFPLLGPVTNIDGLYAGPLWYYFISIGYALFRGHPFGAVFMMIVLNVLLIAFVMLKIRKEISPASALMVGAMWQTSWWFYDASRYGFNPFPLVALSFVMLFFLTDFLRGNKRKYLLAAIPVGLAFHAEVAGSIAFMLFYVLIGFWGIIRKHHTYVNFISGLFVLSLFFVPHGISEVLTGFSQTHVLLNEFHNPAGVFTDTGFHIITPKLLIIIARSTLRQIPTLGVIAFGVTILLAFYSWNKTKKVNRFIRDFFGLSFWLLFVTWIWFGSNTGWREWQTVYLSPVIFVTVLLLLTQIPKKFAYILLIVSLLSHTQVFASRYIQYFRPSDDASILRNEISAVDWVYTHAEGKGFSVYSYLPSVYDYPYQYLFWWRGREKYGYLPCEYASFPGSPKFIIPGAKYYAEPKRPCTALRFLIVEPDVHDEIRNKWLVAARAGTKLIEVGNIGQIDLEKRAVE